MCVGCVFGIGRHGGWQGGRRDDKHGDLDVSLDDNIEDEEYLKKLKDNILLLNKEKYDFVFYVAGVDIHLNDRLGKLKISEDGIKRRDEMIINNFFEKNVPICGVLGGGYNKDFETLVRLHAILHKTCASVIWKKIQIYLLSKN